MIGSPSLNYASDRLQDLKDSYEKAVKTKFEFRYLDPEYYEPKKEKKAPTHDEDRELRIAEALGRTARSLNLPASSVFTREQLLQRREDFNTKLYHALNASISHVSDYLDQALKEDSLEWIQQHSYCFVEPGVRQPLEGVTFHSIEEGEDGTPNIRICTNAQLYEITRQKLCLQLTYFWSIVVFWKKSIFPNDNVQSYSSFSAHALKNQIGHLLNKSKKDFQAIPIDKENKEIDHYPLAIIDILENINKALPVEIQHIVKVGKTHSSRVVDSKIKHDTKLIEEKQKIYEKTYREFFSKYEIVDKHITTLMYEPFKAIHSKPFLSNFQVFYEKFRNYRFPSAYGNIKFFHSPLNFQKLMPEIIWDTILGKETPLSEQCLSGPSGSSGSITTAPHELKENAKSEEKGKEEAREEPETEAITYGEDYWRGEHEKHQERKKAASLIVTTPQAQVSEYEKNLYDFLRDRIYKYEPIKVREIKKELRDLKFKVTSNQSGNGSVHYVSPSEDNPIFGNDENYAGAYFNVHLPHSDGEIIPRDYFKYMKSGFSNVFGLRINP
jgi:hypothetical protein